jgi:hypothetical protein
MAVSKMREKWMQGVSKAVLQEMLPHWA